MPNPRLSSKEFLIVKEEATPGVDPSLVDANGDLTAGAVGLYVETMTVKKLNAKTIDRNQIKPFMGSSLKVTASFDAQIDFDIALAIGGDATGVPTPGTVPAYDVVLRGCGMTRAALHGAGAGDPITGTASGGTIDSITLAGASATSGIYEGLAVVTVESTGTARAPGTAGDKTTVSLALADPATTTDYYAGMYAKVTYFASAAIAGAYDSTVDQVYLPAATVGTNNLVGCQLTVVTTATGKTETRKIIGYERLFAGGAHKGLATLERPLSAAPGSATHTFTVSNTRKILASNFTTDIITLEKALILTTTTTSTYAIMASAENGGRLITSYNGATKVATVTPPFLQAPTNAATYSINSSIKYMPSSSGHISNTFYYYEDGALHTFTYARGKVSFEFSSGAIPIAKFSYMGVVDRYEDASFPAFSFAEWVEPLPVNYDNTKNLMLHYYADTVMDKISFDLGNELVHLNCPGTDQVYIKDRAVKGSLTIWSPLKSEFDIFSAVKSGVARPVSFTHGPVGNQISVFCKAAQLLNPSDSEKDGIKMVTVELNIVPTGTGNNDIALILQ